MSLLKSLFSRRPDRGSGNGRGSAGSRDGYAPVTQDTQSAIAELSQVVRNNPDAVEIYLALGNLYRSHGEIERAVQIRQNLIVRPGLDTKVAARTWFELGKDFKRGGFLDRALAAFEEAKKLGGDTTGIIAELALLTADAGDFERAARYYGQLGNDLAQAHYMVRLSQDQFADDNDTLAFKWLKKALKTFPGTLEGWLELLTQDLRQDDWPGLTRHLDQALSSVAKDQRFVLLEGLLDASKRRRYGDRITFETDKPFQYHPQPEFAEAVLPVLQKQEPDLLLQYYAAWMLCRHDPEESRRWLEKTLVLQPEFWPARLELLALDMTDQELSAPFHNQLEFFILRARELKRFVCRRCGLKRETLFFICPRCRSWHSIKYRTTINE